MKVFIDIIRRQSGQSRLAILSATVLVAVLPFFLASAYSPFPGGLSNKAMAAYDASDRTQILRGMGNFERTRYGRTVRDLLAKNSDAFLEMVGGDLELALSMPSLKRTDGPMQIWQYRSGVCVLDVFLQENNVVHYEMRSPGKAVLRAVSKSGEKMPDNAACMKTLLNT